jgi:hypothetical protein
MNGASSTTQSTATAANAVALAIVVIVQWILSLRGVLLPADVATAISVVLAAGAHAMISARRVAGLNAAPAGLPVQTKEN